jgi:ketosteroid isomerase-like protein
MFSGVDPGPEGRKRPGMARSARPLLVLLLLLAGALRAAEPDAEEPAIRRLNDDYVRAYLASDVARFSALLGDDFTAVLASGVVVGKAEFLRLAAVRPDALDLRLHDVTIRVYGEAALVGALVGYRRSDGADVRTRYTSVFVRRDGRWVLVSVQWTRVVAAK